MKNVTITMEEALVREVRIEAAKAGKSMSRFIADTVEAALSAPSEEKRRAQVDALKTLLDGPALSIADDQGKMPTAAERNARR